MPTTRERTADIRYCDIPATTLINNKLEENITISFTFPGSFLGPGLKRPHFYCSYIMLASAVFIIDSARVAAYMIIQREATCESSGNLFLVTLTRLGYSV